MAEVRLSPEAQQLLMEMQIFQQQVQTVMAQKENLNLQSMEIDKALEELEKAKDDDVYKAVGPILIKSSKKDLKTELNEKKETIGLRLKSLEKQEERMKEKLKESQEKLEDIIKTGEGKKAAAE